MMPSASQTQAGHRVVGGARARVAAEADDPPARVDVVGDADVGAVEGAEVVEVAALPLEAVGAYPAVLDRRLRRAPADDDAGLVDGDGDADRPAEGRDLDDRAIRLPDDRDRPVAVHGLAGALGREADDHAGVVDVLGAAELATEGAEVRQDAVRPSEGVQGDRRRSEVSPTTAPVSLRPWATPVPPPKVPRSMIWSSRQSVARAPVLAVR
jgi:hypothetical protein